MGWLENKRNRLILYGKYSEINFDSWYSIAIKYKKVSL
jgi:hypothetical protein